MIGSRYSPHQIARAEKMKVALKHKTPLKDYYQTKIFEKKKWSAHEVIVKTGEGISLKDRFNCDCFWWSNETIHGNKFCSHCLAVLKKLCEEGVIDKSIWTSVVEGEFIY